MTASNVITTPDGVVLVSDTASYTTDGRINQFKSKAYVNERHRWGTVSTGSAVACDFFRANMPDVDLDTARRFLPSAMRHYHEILAKQIGEDAHFGLVLAGWSDEGQAWEACIIRSWGGAPLNFEPFTAYSGGSTFSPNPQINGVVRPLTDVELGWNYGALGYLETARRILMAQRRAKVVVERGRPPEACVIGGRGEAAPPAKPSVSH